jgi:hypothetical protein
LFPPFPAVEMDCPALCLPPPRSFLRLSDGGQGEAGDVALLHLGGDEIVHFVRARAQQADAKGQKADPTIEDSCLCEARPAFTSILRLASEDRRKLRPGRCVTGMGVHGGSLARGKDRIQPRKVSPRSITPSASVSAPVLACLYGCVFVRLLFIQSSRNPFKNL